MDIPDIGFGRFLLHKGSVVFMGEPRLVTVFRWSVGRRFYASIKSTLYGIPLKVTC